MADMHRVAVISDTHDLLRDEVMKIISGCDAVIHAGDFSGRSTYEQIRDASVQLFAVRGNTDAELSELPAFAQFSLFGTSFFVVHRKCDIPADIKADVIIHGHDHRYDAQVKNGALWLDPGSCGSERLFLSATMAVLEIDDSHIAPERIDLSRRNIRSSDISAVTTDMVCRVCADTDRGMKAEQIARKRGIDPALAQQIARMYVTHPGVTPEGIMAKLGL